MIVKLIQLAAQLDSLGLIKDANEIDQLCAKLAAPEPKTYKVEKRDREYYIVGLANEWEPNATETLLMYRYPEGDIDPPYDAGRMFGALYDQLQVNPYLHDGDRFTTPFGDFKVVGYEVVPEFDLPPETKKEKKEDEEALTEEELKDYYGEANDMPVSTIRTMTQVPEAYEVVPPVVNKADEAFEDEKRPHIVGRLTKAIFTYKELLFKLFQDKGNAADNDDFMKVGDVIQDMYQLTPQEEDMVEDEIMKWVGTAFAVNDAEDEDLAAIVEEPKTPPALSKEDRFKLIKERHELMKLRKMLEKMSPPKRHLAGLDEQIKVAAGKEDKDKVEISGVPRLKKFIEQYGTGFPNILRTIIETVFDTDEPTRQKLRIEYLRTLKPILQELTAVFHHIKLARLERQLKLAKMLDLCDVCSGSTKETKKITDPYGQMVDIEVDCSACGGSGKKKKVPTGEKWWVYFSRPSKTPDPDLPEGYDRDQEEIEVPVAADMTSAFEQAEQQLRDRYPAEWREWQVETAQSDSDRAEEDKYYEKLQKDMRKGDEELSSEYTMNHPRVELDADDKDKGLLDSIKEKLKNLPELATEILMLIKENPEILELLAL